jgi:hypothetical protein
MTEEGSYPPDHLQALKQDRPANAAGAANARILIALVDVAAGVVAIAYPNISGWSRWR